VTSKISFFARCSDLEVKYSGGSGCYYSVFISVIFVPQAKCSSPLEDVRIGSGAQLPSQWVTNVLSAGVNGPGRAADRPLRLVLR